MSARTRKNWEPIPRFQSLPTFVRDSSPGRVDGNLVLQNRRHFLHFLERSKLSWHRGFAVISLLTPLACPRLWQRESRSNPSVQATDSHKARDQFLSASLARRLAWWDRR